MLWLLKLGITMQILSKDDIEFDTEFPCLLGHTVYVSVISHDPPCKDGNLWFTTVPLKDLYDQV